MMLSPQAARMGTVHTTLRSIGCKKIYSQALSTKSSGGRGDTLTSYNKAFTTSKVEKHNFLGRQNCWKSTAALDYSGSNDVIGNFKPSLDNSLGTKPESLSISGHSHALAAEYRNLNDRSLVDEPWRINLGRGNDNVWLMQPRNASDWFTGVSPSNKLCPGTDKHGYIGSLSLPNLSTLTRQSIQDYYDNSWTLYETLFAGLKGEEPFYRPPVHGLRHPQIFYYGHSACLYINKLRVSGVLHNPVNPYFESIFEIGVDEMLWDDMHKNDMLWPMVSEVREYRKQVYETVSDVIQNHPSLDDSNGPVKVDQNHPMWALFMGFEHERIHLETSSVLFRETPLHLVQTPTNWPPLHPSAYRNLTDVRTSNPLIDVDYPSNEMIPVNQNQSVDLGKPADFPSYGWDNEYGERRVNVPPFQASKHMITNGEFWEFVESGGYRTREYWSDDAWAWKTHRNMKCPFFWELAGPTGSNKFHLRTIFEIIPMAWDWPVEINYYEAKAYCQWKTATTGTETPFRVLTEAEHHIIRHSDHNINSARKNVNADKVMVTDGFDFPSGSMGSNLNLAYSSPNPVDYFAPSETGHMDPTGNAWEWTEDHFNPLKGFEVHHVYDDFSTPCFDGKHSMIVGGSFMSTGDEASVFARFHFRPHFLQHSGFRLVTSDYEAPATNLFAGQFDGQAARSASSKSSPQTGESNDNDNVYETDNSLHMYLGLHYSASGDKENVPPILPHDHSPLHGLNFPQRVANILSTLKPIQCNNHALDVGCAVGGASFELAKTFDHVDALDFSSSFIKAAQRMQNNPENVSFRIPIEAEIYKDVNAIHSDGVTSEVRSKVRFFTGDACNMTQMADDGLLKSYDGIIMSNLLCRLPDPVACLNSLPGLVNPGGVVVMVTPFSWLTEFTPRRKWLGGFLDPVTKEPIYSNDALLQLMESRGFEKIHEEEIPLVIREHQRKYQYIISLATGWRKIV